MHQSNDYKYSGNRSDPTKYIEEKVAVNHNLDRLAVGAKLIRERQERFILTVVLCIMQQLWMNCVLLTLSLTGFRVNTGLGNQRPAFNTF